jgi:nucleoside-diphosphate-sugar epimerase
MAKNCIITGGSGFMGKNLITYLKERNTDVDALARNKLHSIIPEHLNSYDAVVHLAGIAHDLKNGSSATEYYNINYGLTKDLFDAFLISNAKKFIFISSVKAVADQVSDVLTEDEIPNPETDYGKSKLLAEKYIGEQILPKEKSVYILRPCMTHGKGNKGNLNLLFKLINSGLPYPLAAFENKRSFLSIQNFCFIIKEIIDRDNFPPPTYNIADDVPLSTNKVVSILSTSLGKDPILLKVPQQIIRHLGKVGTYLNLSFNTDRLNKLTENYVVSNEKIKIAINKSLPLSSAEGLELTAGTFASIVNKEKMSKKILIPSIENEKN